MLKTLFRPDPDTLPPIEMPKRPGPAKAESNGPSAEYRALVEELKVPAPYLKRIDMLEFLDEHGIKVYNNAAVNAYMNATVKALNQKNDREYRAGRMSYGEAADPLRWDWRDIDNYQKPIPIRVLKNMKIIRDLHPKAHFVVTEIATYPDPFIAWVPVGCNNRNDYVIFDCWDEPGYEDRK